MFESLFRQSLCWCCRWLMYRTSSYSSLQTSGRLAPLIPRQFESSNRQSKRNTARRTRAAQTCLSISACSEIAVPWGQSHTVFLREGSGMEPDRLDSHILRASDLRTLVRRLGIGAWALKMSPTHSGGDPHDCATATRIRLLDEGVDQHFWIGSLRGRSISAEKAESLGLHQPKA